MKLIFYILIIAAICCSSCSTAPSSKSMTGAATTIYLVRHAEKMDDGTNDPPLTTEGKARAERLSKLLLKEKITHIYSSDYKRTQETAIPISRNSKVPIRSYDPRSLEPFSNQLRDLKGLKVLVVGHSNSTPTLANLLLEREEFQQFDESDYGNIITVSLQGAKRKAKKTKY